MFFREAKPSQRLQGLVSGVDGAPPDRGFKAASGKCRPELCEQSAPHGLPGTRQALITMALAQ